MFRCCSLLSTATQETMVAGGKSMVQWWASSSFANRELDVDRAKEHEDQGLDGTDQQSRKKKGTTTACDQEREHRWEMEHFTETGPSHA